MSLFKKDKDFVVVEMDLRPKIMTEDEDSIRALATHPGFQCLVNDLKLQRSFLLTQLQRKQESLRDVDRIQAGLEWLGYLQHYVDRKVFKRAEAKAVAARPDEREQFNQVMAQIEGINPTQSV